MNVLLYDFSDDFFSLAPWLAHSIFLQFTSVGVSLLTLLSMYRKIV